MDHITFKTQMETRDLRGELLLSLLYEVVERTGNHREGYYALRRYNDLCASIIHNAAKQDDMATAMHQVMADTDRTLDCLQADIDRIDS